MYINTVILLIWFPTHASCWIWRAHLLLITTPYSFHFQQKSAPITGGQWHLSHLWCRSLSVRSHRIIESMSFPQTPSERAALNIFLWNILQQKQNVVILPFPFPDSTGLGSYSRCKSNCINFLQYEELGSTTQEAAYRTKPKSLCPKVALMIWYSPLLMRGNYYKILSLKWVWFALK